MRKSLAMLFAGLLLTSAQLKADYDLDDTSSVSIEENVSEKGPFNISMKGDYLLRTKFKHHDGDKFPGIEKDHFQYWTAEAEVNAVVYYEKCFTEGLIVGIGFDHAYFNWTNNPFFSQKNFNNLELSVAFFTERLCDWLWKTSVAMNLDTDRWDFNEYTTYDLVLWGRYSLCCNWGIHVGIYAETGMKLDRVLPILGFDWTINDYWTLNAVFPMNMALVYKWNKCTSLSLAVRMFSDRHRVGPHENLEKALWRYSNAGLEIAANHAFDSWINLNVHAGYTAGGRIRIANKENHDSERFKLRSTPYFGAELTMNF